MGSGPLSQGFIDRTGPQTGTLMLNVDFFFKVLCGVVLHIPIGLRKKKKVISTKQLSKGEIVLNY